MLVLVFREPKAAAEGSDAAGGWGGRPFAPVPVCLRQNPSKALFSA